ncbi:MAG: ABC transporter substrate-binding protein, partial [Clostridia bacterium]|nr:ABC transporter substrate-binding protein [Clostridia bacterium]
MKKILALLLAAMMVLSLCAVSFAEEISVKNAEDVWAKTWADVDTSKHVVINYMTTGDAPTTGANPEMMAELNKILTDKINAELNIVWISWTDYLAKYNL